MNRLFQSNYKKTAEINLVFISQIKKYVENTVTFDISFRNGMVCFLEPGTRKAH